LPKTATQQHPTFYVVCRQDHESRGTDKRVGESKKSSSRETHWAGMIRNLFNSSLVSPNKDFSASASRPTLSLIKTTRSPGWESGNGVFCGLMETRKLSLADVSTKG